jgi:UDP-arabinose 4-epimerase
VRVLVAGGAGYAGSHTCKALSQAGYTPIVYDNLRSGHAWVVKWGPLEQGDLNDATALADAMRRHRPQADLGNILGSAWPWMTEHRMRAMTSLTAR